MNRIDELLAEYCAGGVAHARIGDVLPVVSTPRGIKRGEYDNGTKIPIVDQGQGLVAGHTDDDSLRVSGGPYIVFGDHTRAVKWVDFPFAVGADGTKVLRSVDGLIPKFAYYALTNLDITDRGYNRHWTIVREMKIPVPPPEVQSEIVRVLDRLTAYRAKLEAELGAELEARRRQYEHYRSALFAYGADATRSDLGGLARNLDSRRRPVTKGVRTAGDIPYYGASGIVDYVSEHIFEGDYLLVSEDGANLLARSTPIAFSISGKTWVNNHAHVLEFATYVERRFVEIYLNSIDLAPYISGAAQPKLNKASLNSIPIPDPTFAQKKRVVSLLDRFDAYVNDLSVTLLAELAARRKQYEYYRNRLLTFGEVN